jgi:hypothetical protein
MVATDEQILDVIERAGPLAGLVDQLVKNLNQERMKALLS